MYPLIKRVLDILISFALLVLLAPLLVLLWAVVRLDSPGPALFRQKRVGRDGALFDIFKFRTMRADTPPDLPTHLLTDASRRVTRVGRVLRRTSLDELPQLVNILKGDMSLVGPRPALWNQEDLMTLRYANGSAALRPGLTGWAQVNGRDELTIEEKAALDGVYARRAGPVMDVRVCVRTLIQAFRGDGVRDGAESSGVR